MYYRSRDPIINALIWGGAFNFKIISTIINYPQYIIFDYSLGLHMIDFF